MRKTLLALVGVVLVAVALPLAQELVTLTTPETKPNNPNYRVDRVLLDSGNGVLTILLLGVNGEAVTCSYSPLTTPTGTFLINALNKADLSSAYAGNATTGSLKQRVFHRLVVMNEAPAVCGRSLVGTLTGSPQ